MRIAIIASGVVGKATGVGLESKGHDVVFYDIDALRLAQIQEERHTTASSVREAVTQSDVTMICAPTPTKNGKPDLSVLVQICSEVGRAVQDVKSYHLIVIRSTIPPGTTRRVVVPCVESSAHLNSGQRFGVCHNPEFLREKFASDDFLQPRAVIIGEMDKIAGDTLESIYSPFESKIFRCSPETSEMIKYTSNLFNATKVSFFNEIDNVCKSMGVKSEEVSRLMPILALGLRDDLPEWGIYGGRAFGGMCLSKDLDAFIEFVRSKGLASPLLEAVRKVNRTMEEKDQKAPMILART